MSNLSIAPATSWDSDLTQDRTTLLNRLGKGIGNVFLSTKRRAKDKYLEVTKGINLSIEAEEEQRALAFQAEMDACLLEQAEYYEEKLHKLKRRSLGWAFVFGLFSFVAGMATVVYLQHTL